MITRRNAEERGHTRAPWLESRHSFAFADYRDPRHPGFRSLRVLNEDWIAPANGFGPHPHRDMEILTVPISGRLEHQDSEGSRATLSRGRIQLMSAGQGIVHSEMNPSTEEELHLLQIWITPDRAGYPAGHQEATVGSAAGLQAIVTPDGRDGTLPIRQDAHIYTARAAAGAELRLDLAPGRHAWVQMLEGEAEVTGEQVGAGDGLALSNEPTLTLTTEAGAEALIFDLA